MTLLICPRELVKNVNKWIRKYGHFVYSELVEKKRNIIDKEGFFCSFKVSE